uniref:Protection of telomeres protein 1 n=1 Tax=Kalmanozyma brasiliensis (strain GHG001) TaxID=1365824 RepID=V5ETH9_KALBG
MGNCLYTPMSMVRDGERASIIGVVVAAGDPRRSTSGTRDLSIKITIADASCLSGTGYAKELARSMTVMLFAQQSERIPQNVKPGHIVAVRGVHIQMFSGKPQAVGKSAATWSWAIYDPVSGDVRASSNFPLASHTPPECSAEEMEHFRDMANWFSELQGVDANIMTRSSRPTLKLQKVGENTFFDTVVEVLKVYTHTLAPDLYVTDYTNHTLFYRGNDKYLRLESEIPYPDDTDGWGHVFQISLWDSHATIAEGLQTGDIIRIQNVRPKLNPRGLLTGGLGSSTDSGIKIRTLKPTDEARIDLEKRRTRFMETLFNAEEEAFADRAERDFGRASQEEPNAHQQAQPGEQNHQAEPTIPARQKPIAPPFPTPAQRQARVLQEATPSKNGNAAPTALGTSNNGNRTADDLSQIETPDVKPSMIMGPPDMAVEERRPLIRCNAPASVPLTALAELPTTSLCPGMFKVKARVISTNPAKVEQWGRAECKACKRLLPLDQRFCIKCGDEEGESLSYCLRFAIMLEEVDSEYVARKQQQRAGAGAAEASSMKVAIPLLFHGRMAEVLLPCVDAKAVFKGERSGTKALKRFHQRLLHPNEYGLDPEQVLAVYSYPSQESGRTVRRFAALKELNCLHSPRDLL